ncbi:MAG TPA: substrate-binding domain-containing protein [Rectinemataceae bacterium]|nr:substrate-binding domain-containing protein [Rectinemataceae bacterium]
MEIKGISSQALRLFLAEMAEVYRRRFAVDVAIESIGGLDAVARIQSGEAFDLVVLAADAIDKLLATGQLQAGSKVDLAQSEVAVAVREGMPRPDISTEEAFKKTILAAKSIGYSTGPSGIAIIKLFERWGILETIGDRLVQATSGTPVGSLIARGDLEIGFQQLGELLPIGGITVLGTLPKALRIVTTFSGALGSKAGQTEAARAFLAFLASQEAAEAKRCQGMDPA